MWLDTTQPLRPSLPSTLFFGWTNAENREALGENLENSTILSEFSPREGRRAAGGGWGEKPPAAEGTGKGGKRRETTEDPVFKLRLADDCTLSLKPVKLSLEKDEEEARKGRWWWDSGEGRERERERRREVGRAASERTVKPPFERNRLGDEFEREGEGRFEGGAAGVVTNTEMVKVY